MALRHILPKSVDHISKSSTFLLCVVFFFVIFHLSSWSTFTLYSKSDFNLHFYNYAIYVDLNCDFPYHYQIPTYRRHTNVLFTSTRPLKESSAEVLVYILCLRSVVGPPSGTASLRRMFSIQLRYSGNSSSDFCSPHLIYHLVPYKMFI